MNENSATVVNQNFFLLIKAFFTYSAKSRLTDSVLANLGKSVCSFVLHKWIRTHTLSETWWWWRGVSQNLDLFVTETDVCHSCVCVCKN